MLALNERLRLREAQGCPIRMSVTGAEWMGSGFLAATERMPGMRALVLVDDDIDAARRAFSAAGCPADRVAVAENVGQAMDALRAGKRVVTPVQDVASGLEWVDMVVDVTPDPAIGARTAWSAIQHGKDIVLVNIEADATVGPVLHHWAQKAGLLYSVSSGDEPGCIQELYDFAGALGYEVVAVGKGKNNPLDRSANPDNVVEMAKQQGKEPAQVASYVDGSKTMFEMCCISNALGFPPDVPGMHGPLADLESITRLFALRDDGGMLSRAGVVDYVTGPAMAGGVWIIVRVPDERIAADLRYLKVGRGPYFCLSRPYHLWFLEAGISVARAFLDRQPTLVPLERRTSEVACMAKKDLVQGERLDGIGGYTHYGLIVSAEDARKANALPVGLAKGAVLRREVPRGEAIAHSDVELDESSLIVRLRREQDSRSMT